MTGKTENQISRKKQIENLLKENKNILLNGERNNGICYDGIVNEKEYENVVVLLKETNGCDSNGEMPEKLEDWNYCRWLKDQQADNIPEKRVNKKGETYEEKNVFYHSTFRKLCFWLCMLFDSFENETVNPEKYLKGGKVDVEKVRKILNRVAVVNMKKTWGNKQTDRSVFEKYLTTPEIREILRKQMDILAPKIVLCCSQDVFNIAVYTYLGEINYPYQKESNVIVGKSVEFAKMNGSIYINFYHPQYYGKSDEMLTRFALETFEQLKQYMKQNNP